MSHRFRLVEVVFVSAEDHYWVNPDPSVQLLFVLEREQLSIECNVNAVSAAVPCRLYLLVVEAAGNWL